MPALDAKRTTFDFEKAELIFKEEDIVTGVYFLNKGKAKVHKKWGDDKELIIRFAGVTEILGHRGLGKEYIYPVSATALEPISACFIDLDFFLTTLKVNNDYAFKLLMFYAEELQISEKNMRNIAHMNVRGRLAYAIITLKEKFGINAEGFINIALSKQDLASYAGTTYETAFRVLNDFVKENLLKLSGKHIFIADEIMLGKAVG